MGHHFTETLKIDDCRESSGHLAESYVQRAEFGKRMGCLIKGGEARILSEGRDVIANGVFVMLCFAVYSNSTIQNDCIYHWVK